MTGALIDPQNVALVREMLWDGIAVVGLADVRDPEIDERLKAIGFVEVYAKPIVVDEVADAIRRLLDRRRLSRLTGLIGQSEAHPRSAREGRADRARVEHGARSRARAAPARSSSRARSTGSSPRRDKPFVARQLRRAARDAARERAVRSREGRVHRRGRASARAVRAGGHGHAVPRRDRRDAAGDAGEAAARAARSARSRASAARSAFPVDVRVVAATNRPLREDVEDGRFRADLYYRLNVLQHRPAAAARAARGHPDARRGSSSPSFARSTTGRSTGISPEALRRCSWSIAWPGNVRELRNLVESMVVLAPGREIGPADIPAADSRGWRRAIPAGARRSDGAGARGRRGAGSSSSSCGAWWSSSSRWRSCAVSSARSARRASSWRGRRGVCLGHQST